MKKWMIALMMAALLIVPMGGIAYAVGEGAPAAPAAGEFIPGDVPAQSGHHGCHGGPCQRPG